jgi:hypothetical protein
MPTLEQAIARRLSEIHDIARSGATEMTGKSRREGGQGEGEFIGRYGGMKPAFPELQHVKDSPKQIAEAIERGKGAAFERVYGVVKHEMQRQGFKARGTIHRGKPTIAPHAGKSYCVHCRTIHTKGQHRFHGPGSFHQTHLFSFNPMSISQAKTVFANLMRRARQGSLTAYQKRELSVARQVLRMQRRPAMNRPKRNPEKDYSQPPATFKRYVTERLGMLPAATRPDILRELWNREFRGAGKNKRRMEDFLAWEQGRNLYSEGPLFGQNRRRRLPRGAVRLHLGRPRRNPGGKSKIYGRLLEMRMQRTGPHRCDKKCEKAGHRYKHVFKSGPIVYGLPNGSILIEGR